MAEAPPLFDVGASEEDTNIERKDRKIKPLRGAGNIYSSDAHSVQGLSADRPLELKERSPLSAPIREHARWRAAGARSRGRAPVLRFCSEQLERIRGFGYESIPTHPTRYASRAIFLPVDNFDSEIRRFQYRKAELF